METTNSYTIFGLALFTLLNVYLNISVSAWRFGWMSAIGLSISSASAAGVLAVIEQKLIHT